MSRRSLLAASAIIPLAMGLVALPANAQAFHVQGDFLSGCLFVADCSTERAAAACFEVDFTNAVIIPQLPGGLFDQADVFSIQGIDTRTHVYSFERASFPADDLSCVRAVVTGILDADPAIPEIGRGSTAVNWNGTTVPDGTMLYQIAIRGDIDMSGETARLHAMVHAEFAGSDTADLNQLTLLRSRVRLN